MFGIIKNILALLVFIICSLFLAVGMSIFRTTHENIDLFVLFLFCIPAFLSGKYIIKNGISHFRKRALKKAAPALVPSEQLQQPVSEVHTVSTITTPNVSSETNSNFKESHICLPEWYVSISFGKSSSQNYHKAVALAKLAPQYHEQTDNGQILHQAIYSDQPKEYLAFIKLYELVGSWKSSFVIINGQFIDRKIVGKLNYCYGDKCRSSNPKFCYGASYMTENPFGCHRLQISAANTPWWSFYKRDGFHWVLDRVAMKERIDSFAEMYYICPDFNYEQIISAFNQLPSKLSDRQMKSLSEDNFGCRL